MYRSKFGRNFRMIGILFREEIKEYDFGPGHPFRGNRYELFIAKLTACWKEGIDYRLLQAEAVRDDELRLICTEDYIEFTKDFYRREDFDAQIYSKFYHYHSGDNRPTGGRGKIEEAARFVVGQAKMACELIQQGEFAKVVSLGGGMHHAKPSYGEGFCLYNDVAFCTLYLLERYKLNRIMVIDTDAHAGNGTCEYFYEEPRVLFIDIHQDPLTLYPGTGFANEIGKGKGKGFTINIPLPVGAGFDSYLLAFESIIKPLAGEFKPQIILRNGGSDPHFQDGLAKLSLPLKGFRMIGDQVREMAQLCDGKVIDFIASGYNERILPAAWLNLIAGLAGINLAEAEREDNFEESGFIVSETKRVLEEVKGNLRDYWLCLQK